MRGLGGLLKIVVFRLKVALGLISSSAMGVANTALEFHDRRLLALHESDAPYVVRVMQDGQLETIGRLTYGEQLKHPVTAHPKVDPVTKEMMVFGYSLHKEPWISYSVIAPCGDLLRTVPIRIPTPIMAHDFAITEHFTILMDLPLEFKPKRMLHRDSLPFEFNDHRKSRFGILPRHANSSDAVRWFESEPCFVFHVVNAWEENNGTEVVLVVCRIKRIDLEDVKPSKDDPPMFHEWRFNLESGQVQSFNFEGAMGDFPRIHPEYTGRRCRFAYAAPFKLDSDSSAPLIDGVIKVDLWRRQVVGRIQYAPWEFGGECVFVPRHPRSISRSEPKPLSCMNGAGLKTLSLSEAADEEDDGFLMTFVHSEAVNVSSFVVFDAKSMRQVARVPLPQRVPYGFHGLFVSEEAMASQRIHDTWPEPPTA